jgi:bifunctional phosphoglucose/phosphomannose isomerase
MRKENEMFQRMLEFPEAIAEATKLGEQTTIPLRYFKKYVRVGFLAMGGSGSGADLLANWFPHLDIHNVHDYSIPPYFGNDTLCVAITYSGKTEETIAAAIEAHRKGCPLFGIGGGATLKEVCGKFGETHIDIPLKFQPTRIGTAFVTFTPAALLSKLGLVQIEHGEIKGIIDACGKVREACANPKAKRNPAMELAKSLKGLPVTIYAPANLSGVAIKMKNDLAENSKILSKWELLPEGNHHDVSCFQEKPKAAAVLIRSPADESPRMKTRLDLTAKALKRSAKKFSQLTLPQEKSRMARLTAGAYFGMFVSYYLRTLQGRRKSVLKTPLQEAVKNRMPKGFVEELVASL